MTFRLPWRSLPHLTKPRLSNIKKAATYVQVPKVFIVVQGIANHKTIGNLKANVWNKRQRGRLIESKLTARWFTDYGAATIGFNVKEPWSCWLISIWKAWYSTYSLGGRLSCRALSWQANCGEEKQTLSSENNPYLCGWDSRATINSETITFLSRPGEGNRVIFFFLYECYFFLTETYPATLISLGLKDSTCFRRVFIVFPVPTMAWESRNVECKWK